MKVVFPRPDQCRYIFGDIVTDDWRYCLKTREAGRSYCETHSKLCHHQPRREPGVRPQRREYAT